MVWNGMRHVDSCWFVVPVCIGCGVGPERGAAVVSVLG